MRWLIPLAMLLSSTALYYAFLPGAEATCLISLGFEKSGVRIEIFSIRPEARPAEAFERICVVQDGRYRQLHRLKDLENLVRIRNRADALRFVRLRSAVDTWHAWDDVESLVEVLSSDKLRTLRPFCAAKLYRLSYPSGYLGILSNKAYETGGFSSAQVDAVRDGFIVQRWVLSEVRNGGNQQRVLRVKLLREHVGLRGEYGIEVVKCKSPPVIDATRWQFGSFE